MHVLFEPPPFLKSIKVHTPRLLWIHPCKGLVQDNCRHPVPEFLAQFADFFEVQSAIAIHVSVVEQSPHADVLVGLSHLFDHRNSGGACRLRKTDSGLRVVVLLIFAGIREPPAAILR